MRNIRTTIFKVSALFVFTFWFYSCTNKPRSTNNIYQLNIGVDMSLKAVVSEILELFNYYNPKVILNSFYGKPSVITEGFNDNKYDLIIIPEQKKYNWRSLNTFQIYPKEQKIFSDALIFISSKNNPINSINIKELISSAKPKFKRIVIDSNININYYKSLFTIGKKDTPNKNFFFSDSLNTNNILKYLKENELLLTNMASIANNNLILNSSNILAINSQEHIRQFIIPSQKNLYKKKYPLTINIFAVYKNIYPYLDRSFIDFALGQISQLIIYKYGLLPVKLRRRIIELKN